jgi:hypothetical protein
MRQRSPTPGANALFAFAGRAIKSCAASGKEQQIMKEIETI